MLTRIGFAQNTMMFEQLTGDNVSTQSIAYATKQDAIGNIWIASEEGILKHNSKSFKFYNTYNGLPESLNNRITQLFIDSKQRIWAGSEKGICLYDETLDEFILVGNEKSINPSLVIAFAEDSKGNIWIGGYNGLWKYSNQKNIYMIHM